VTGRAHHPARPNKVLLLDVGWPQSAFVILHLRRAGFEVVRAIPGALDTLGIGHYCRQIQAPGDFNAPFLAELLQREPADFVVPLSEEIFAQLWQLPADLTRNVFPATTAFQRDALLDRRAMYRIATEEGVPIPSMHDLASDDDLPRAVEALGLPLVLRGTAGIGGRQVRIVQSLEEAGAELRDLRSVSPGAPFAQRMIHGPRHLVGVMAVEGRVINAFAQTTVDGVRPPTGPSIRVRAVHDDTLVGHAERLFARLAWNGLACAEFVQDGDGVFHFMEINPRPWAAIRAAHNCGVPLLDDFTAHLAGEPVRPTRSSARLRDVPLFPQYLDCKVLGHSPFRLRDLPHALRCAASAPWTEPFLMLHFARSLWWQR
jgi:hypothetical protein